jgi:hypothetical protein
MGEVYRARDSKLKRDVALKVLPDVFARDPERMLRFQREAELLAALNHPEVQCEDLREESRTGLGRGALSADIASFLVTVSKVMSGVRSVALASSSLYCAERPGKHVHYFFAVQFHFLLLDRIADQDCTHGKTRLAAHVLWMSRGEEQLRIAAGDLSRNACDGCAVARSEARIDNQGRAVPYNDRYVGKTHNRPNMV